MSTKKIQTYNMQTCPLHNRELKTHPYQSTISSGAIAPVYLRRRRFIADIAAPNSSAEFLVKVQFSNRAKCPPEIIRPATLVMKPYDYKHIKVYFFFVPKP